MTTQHLKNKLENAKYWISSTLPLLVVLLAGLTIFRTAVLDSILSTPHPELVYLIFVSFFVGLVSAWRSLHHFLRERNLLRAWQGADPKDRSEVLGRNGWTSLLVPVYDLLDRRVVLPLRMRQAAVRSEMLEFNKRLSSELAFPGYVGGALVSLGLVGTFIGLLGTLQDLTSLFSSLMGTTGGGAVQTQTELFQGVLGKLQAPMRSMGTAFVAFFYGLLGSLILGLVVTSVRKMGDEVVEEVRQGIRDMDYGSGGNIVTALETDSEAAWAESERRSTLFEEMRDRNQVLSSMMLQMQHESRDVINAARDHNQAMRERNDLDGVIARNIAESTSLLARATEHYKSIMLFALGTRTDIQAMVSVTQVINETFQQRNQIDSLVQRVLGDGPHWLDAWQQMSTELARLRSHAEDCSREELALLATQNSQIKCMNDSTTRQEIAIHALTQEIALKLTVDRSDNRELVLGLKHCRESIEEVGSKLRLQLGMQSTHPHDGRYGSDLA